MKIGDKIVFKFNETTLKYQVVTTLDKRFFLYNLNVDSANSKIFEILEIDDIYGFYEKVVDKYIKDKLNTFPELESLSDLERVVNALYERILEISTPKFKVGDLVMVAKREEKSSDYTCSYTDEMVQYENRIFAISEINKMSIPIMKSYIPRLRYEEPFYYTLEGNDWKWSSAMLHKVGTIKDSIKGVTSLDKVILTDIGEVGVSSYMDAHTTEITCDKAIDGISLYPEKEEPEYKLNFNVKPLKFY